MKQYKTTLIPRNKKDAITQWALFLYISFFYYALKVILWQGKYLFIPKKIRAEE